jgi:DNA-binding transcriptional regulator WhiA
MRRWKFVPLQNPPANFHVMRNPTADRARAAVAASARVQRAMEILGPEISSNSLEKEAGELRINHGQASLEELGSLSPHHQ